MTALAVPSSPAFALRRIIRGVTTGTGSSNTAQRENLLPRIAQGDKSTIALLMDRYGGLVWSLAKRLCETDADAEDAVQDIFVDVWKSAGRFNPDIASETTFVAMIARRRLIDRRRRISRQPGKEAIIEDALRDDADAPSHAPQLSDEARLAEAALAQLSEDQQRVLRLSIHHGLSHDKIAKATGLPLGTVKTHARRGLIRIRKILAEASGVTQEATQ